MIKLSPDTVVSDKSNGGFNVSRACRIDSRRRVCLPGHVERPRDHTEMSNSEQDTRPNERRPSRTDHVTSRVNEKPLLAADRGSQDEPAAGNEATAIAETPREDVPGGPNDCSHENGIENHAPDAGGTDGSQIEREGSTVRRKPRVNDEEKGKVDETAAAADEYGAVRAEAVAAINSVREAHQLRLLGTDDALVLPATAHCRTMCEHGFLSHWDIGGRKPHQRYSDFAFGQHVSEVMYGFDLIEGTKDEIASKIGSCIEERAEGDQLEQGGTRNHLLDGVHTHVGIGIFAKNAQLRYIEVYADRYLELLDAPVELSAVDHASGFQLSVQMISPEVAPYACLVYYDPPPAPLTVAELQEQFRGPYAECTQSQVASIWPWQMDPLDDGVFDIPVPVTTVEPGTYYVQVLTSCDPSSIPYEAEPAGGLPLPGSSFCGGALVIKAPAGQNGDGEGVACLGDEFESSCNRQGATPEEKEAISMASTTALRRDLAPIRAIRVVRQDGAIPLQDDGYEQAIFMPPERAENMTQPNLGLQFLRLDSWNGNSSGYEEGQQKMDMGDAASSTASRRGSIEVEGTEEDKAADNCSDPTTAEPGKDASESGEPGRCAANNGGGDNGDSGDNSIVPEGQMADGDAQQGPEDGEIPVAEELGASGNQTGERPRGTDGSRRSVLAPESEDPLPLVITDIAFITVKDDGEEVLPPQGFDLIPEDLAALAGPSAWTLEDHEGEDQAKSEITPDREETGGGREDQEVRRTRDKVFLCVKRAPYTEAVSPLTDLALVYGTDEFQMGFGFISERLPQAVNEVYGDTLYLCHKSAGASLAMIQHVAETTAEKTAKQIQHHLSIEAEEAFDGESVAEGIQYDVNTNMTQEQMLAWEEKRHQEAVERADKREQADRARARGEAYEAVQRRIEEAFKDKNELLKTNAEWHRKIAGFMFAQQKTREEARTEHAGRGVEKEGVPVHESEKHYAECLSAIVSYRERLREQQGEYDKVAIGLQGRLDEKEYKCREIAESFTKFKREIARTAVHSRTGKPMSKAVIAQFEAAEAKKDEEIEKVRLRNINLRMMLKKVEGKLRAKEQLAEGLHLIDFEQLKIENQTVKEKIEERNEELLKLRKKNTTTVQILTHTKEKLQFVAAENDTTNHQLAALEEELNRERDRLTCAKKDRDTLRGEVVKLRHSQGFANSDLLVVDFQQRKSQLKKLGRELDSMRSKHHILHLEQERLRRSNGHGTS